jgi:hypothetical protein
MALSHASDPDGRRSTVDGRRHRPRRDARDATDGLARPLQRRYVLENYN